VAALGQRLFHALTEHQVRTETKPHIRMSWMRTLLQIRGLPEGKR
jgi:hypothetical protein